MHGTSAVRNSVTENVEKKRKNLTTTRQLRCQNVMECATLLRDIRFGMRFFGEKGRKFFFYSWLVSFFHFFFNYRQEKYLSDWIYHLWTNYAKQELQGHTHIFIDHLFCQSVLLTFSVKNWARYGAPGITSRYSKIRVTTVSLPYSLQLCNKFRCHVNQILCQFVGLRINAIDDSYLRLDIRLIKWYEACLYDG